MESPKQGKVECILTRSPQTTSTQSKNKPVNEKLLAKCPTSLSRSKPINRFPQNQG